jgi:hypothetical protein
MRWPRSAVLNDFLVLISVRVRVNSRAIVFFFVFGIPFYLQTVRIHSANGVTREACRGALSSTSSHLTGSKPCVSVGKIVYLKKSMILTGLEPETFWFAA